MCKVLNFIFSILYTTCKYFPNTLLTWQLITKIWLNETNICVYWIYPEVDNRKSTFSYCILMQYGKASGTKINFLSLF